MAHPLDELSEKEIKVTAAAVRAFSSEPVRFNSISMKEPPKAELAAFAAGSGPKPARIAAVVLQTPVNGKAYEADVELTSNGEEGPHTKVLRCDALPHGVQPPFSPDDCFLAEEIVKKDERFKELMKERYGITDMNLVACDPWSIHLAVKEYEPMSWRKDGIAPRLVQTFLYRRDDADDNHYAHPIDLLPVVDLNAEKVVVIHGVDRPAPKIPAASVNYHRNKLTSNTYLPNAWRAERLAALDVVQPEGPSFTVEGRVVTWQRWTLRIGFNYREGLVLHDVRFDGRPVMNRGSLVEMAVPYGDPNPPFERKCAFDVGDYGLGFCANSLELGCDCLGHIHYFDALLNDSKGEPFLLKKAVCMHEEDMGLLWKHMEYRNGHAESRRSRRLVLSFIATVVNYEYLFYWYLMQDGMIEFEIKLSGELSTNLLSEGETAPEWGVMVAPGVNAQVHQHMFCARLDMAVDGEKNSVMEVDIEQMPAGKENPYGNAFRPKKTLLKTEQEAKRVADASVARTWRIFNPHVMNSISGLPVAYKLVPFTKGPAQPILVTRPECSVTKRGEFATKSIWVTPHRDNERFPAGEYTPQSLGGEGLPAWTSANRKVEDEDIVVWYAFGVCHIPRPEDFPVMPVEFTGFSLKPDGFFTGNPTIDLPPSKNAGSKCCSHKEEQAGSCTIA